MVRKAYSLVVLAAIAWAAETGAVSNQVETMLYDTHQKVTNLNKNLDGAVKKLNETSTQLLERVTESENQTRQLRTLVEESQVKLDTLEQELGELTATIYRQFNLTTSGAGFTPPPATGDDAPGTSVEIQPPAVSANDEAMERTPPSVETPGTAVPAAAQEEYQQAQKAWLGDDYSGALSKFTDYLSRYPGSELSGNAQYWQGRCYLKLEQYDEAVAAFEKVRVNFPDNDSKVSQAMQSQAVALSRLGKNEEAARLLEEVIKKYPATGVARQAEADLAKLRGN